MANSGSQVDEGLRRKLRQTRLDAGLRQVELAARLGEPQSFVSKYENGERKLTFAEVRRICMALQKNFLEFVRDFESELE